MWYQPIQSVVVWGLEIQVWGFMLALGSILGWLLLDYNLLWRKIKIDTSWLVLGFIFFSLIGARLLHVALNISAYSDNWFEVLYLWQGGMASFGGFIFGIAFIWFYQKNFIKERAKDFWDATVPSMCLALFLTRTGCFLINDHIGRVADLPWSILALGELRHPISMYYALAALVLFVISLNFYYLVKYRGKIIWIILILYGVFRLVLDLLFKDFFGDNVSYIATIIVSLIIVIFSIIMLYNQNRRIS